MSSIDHIRKISSIIDVDKQISFIVVKKTPFKMILQKMAINRGRKKQFIYLLIFMQKEINTLMWEFSHVG